MLIGSKKTIALTATKSIHHIIYLQPLQAGLISSLTPYQQRRLFNSTLKSAHRIAESNSSKHTTRNLNRLANQGNPKHRLIFYQKNQTEQDIQGH